MLGEGDDKKRDDHIKVLQLPEGALGGPLSHVCRNQKPKPLPTLAVDTVLCSKTPLAKDPMSPPGGRVSGGRNEFVQPTASSPS